MTMGHALCRRGAAVVIVMAGLPGPGGPAAEPAWAQEAPLDDLLVAPPDTTMEVFGSGTDPYGGMSFIENYDLDITVVAQARGALRENTSPRLLVTAVRLSSAREAAEVLAAIGEPVSAEDMGSSAEMDEFRAAFGLPDPYIESLPPPRRDVVARVVVMAEDHRMAEMAWATGRDVVVLADLERDGSGEVPSIMHQTLDAYRAAFPDVTMPAGTRAGPSWTLVGGAALAVLAVVGLLLALAGRRWGTTTPPRPSVATVPQIPGDGPSRARANW